MATILKGQVLWKRYQKEIILLVALWYLAYSLSYRDLEEMMAERNIEVDHSTINRWKMNSGKIISGIVLSKRNRVHHKKV